MPALVFTACTGNPTTDTSECPVGPDESIVECRGDVCLSTAPMPRVEPLEALLDDRGWYEPEPDWPEPQGEPFRVFDCTLDGDRVLRVNDWTESDNYYYRQERDGSWTQISYSSFSDAAGYCGCTFVAVWGEHFCAGTDSTGTDCDWDRVSWGASL